MSSTPSNVKNLLVSFLGGGRSAPPASAAPSSTTHTARSRSSAAASDVPVTPSPIAAESSRLAAPGTTAPLSPPGPPAASQTSPKSTTIPPSTSSPPSVSKAPPKPPPAPRPKPFTPTPTAPARPTLYAHSEALLDLNRAISTAAVEAGPGHVGGATLSPRELDPLDGATPGHPVQYSSHVSTCRAAVVRGSSWPRFDDVTALLSAGFTHAQLELCDCACSAALADVQRLTGEGGELKLEPARVGSGPFQSWASDSIRADAAAWMTDLYTSLACGETGVADVPGLEAVLRALAAVHGRLRSDACLRAAGYVLSPSHVSVQLARYGSSSSGYTRHTDADDSARSGRLFTAIYYLNPQWRHEHGGYLRLWHPSGGCSHQGAAHTPSTSYTDIPPVGGSIVLLNSRTTPHAVTNTYAERYAITLWMYGTYQAGEAPVRAPPRVSIATRARALPSSLAHALAHHTPSPARVRGSTGAMLSRNRRSFSERTLSIAARTNSPVKAHVPLSNGAGALHVCARKRLEAYTLFVMIPAYRDPDTWNTVADAVARAQHPERIFFGVCLQLKADEHDPLRLAEGESDAYMRGWEALPAGVAGRVRLTRTDARDSVGPCLARFMASRSYRGEDVIVSLDAHMRFVDDWDTHLLRQLLAAEAMCGVNSPTLRVEGSSDACPGVCISTYPLDFSHMRDGVRAIGVDSSASSAPCSRREEKELPLPCWPTRMRVSDEAVETVDGTGETFLVPRFAASPQTPQPPLCVLWTLPPDASQASATSTPEGAAAAATAGAKTLHEHVHMPFRTHMLAAGFLAARAHVYMSYMGPDPFLPHVFMGEEAAMCARAYTHGVAVFAPGHSIVWHDWDRTGPAKGRGNFREHAHIGARPGEGDENAWSRVEAARAKERLRALLSSEDAAATSVATGACGRGTVRPWSQWYVDVGVRPRALDVPPGPSAARDAIHSHTSM